MNDHHPMSHDAHSRHDHHPMDHTSEKAGERHHKDLLEPRGQHSTFRLALSATFHCLVGCGIGEVVGMMIATHQGMNNLHSIVLSVILGFVAGLALGILPLIQSQFTLGKAIKTVLVAEGLSIAVMEAFEVITQVMIPGVMEAHLLSPIFWIGMILSLVVGFIAALPVNYLLIKKGIRHLH